ncbi:MAG TPA: hypothetical protein VJ455_10970 [Ignavibacteria bacterium]|nr:hypothetical protein [Ignavibacteria bacterium]
MVKCKCGQEITTESGMGYAICPSCGTTVDTANPNKINADKLRQSIEEKKILMGKIIFK